tara:strand:- start:235 stop:561 length:327 start_codon:yes stop_codon:yes gene_type:complete
MKKEPIKFIKPKLKTKKIMQGLIGGLILWSIIRLTIYFYQNTSKFYLNNKSNKSIINDLKNEQEKNESLCRIWSLSIEECKLYKKTGKFPKDVEDKFEKIKKKIKEKK